MVQTVKNIAQHELIGLEVCIVSSPDIRQAGIRGRVVDETRNMLFIENADSQKVQKVPKYGLVFEFTFGTEKARLKGNDINFRPEDRIKRAR